jgi:hypothetical protein
MKQEASNIMLLLALLSDSEAGSIYQITGRHVPEDSTILFPNFCADASNKMLGKDGMIRAVVDI